MHDVIIQYLHTGFSEIDFGCDLFTHEDIGVAGLGKEILEHIQLNSRERRPLASLLPVRRCDTTTTMRLLLTLPSNQQRLLLTLPSNQQHVL